MHNCKNCQQEYEGNFCPACGQKYIDKRLNLKDSIVWVFDSIFNFDQGFFYTSKALLLKPAVVINNVLNGVTRPYTHPFRHLFIWATLTTIVGIAAGTFDDTQVAMNNIMGADQETIEKGVRAQAFMRRYMNLIIIAMVPLFAMATRLLFRKKGYNYAEHLVINAYSQTVTMMVNIPLSFFYFFMHNPNVLGGLSMLIGAIAATYVFTKVFEENAIVAFLKYILVFIIAFVSAMFITLLGVLVFAKISMMLGMENPFKPA